MTDTTGRTTFVESSLPSEAHLDDRRVNALVLEIFEGQGRGKIEEGEGPIPVLFVGPGLDELGET